MATLAANIAGADILYFTAGSRGKNLLQTDAFGVIKLMQAAEQAGVKRFIMLSSTFADRPEKWHEPPLAALTDYNIAKYLADQWLMHRTALDYTILQPGALTESPGSGKVRLNRDEMGQNSIDNVAAVLAALADAPHTIGQTITMTDGEEDITSAIAALQEKP